MIHSDLWPFDMSLSIPSTLLISRNYKFQKIIYMPHIIWYLATRKQTRRPVPNENLCERIPGNKCSTGESAGKISFAPVPVPVCHRVCQTAAAHWVPSSVSWCQLLVLCHHGGSWWGLKIRERVASLLDRPWKDKDKDKVNKKDNNIDPCMAGEAAKSERGCLPWLIVLASFAVSFIQVGFSYSCDIWHQEKSYLYLYL